MPLSKASRRPSPIRIPGKRESTNRPIIENLTSEQSVDVWEHAALLYHGYEWQAAADTFELLSRSIGDVQQRTLCLLNAGLIQARLGDFDLSIRTFERAASLDPTLLITDFLLALASCGRSDYSRAESCIASCLHGLAQEEDVDYSAIGLDFVLHQKLLLNDLREIRRAQLTGMALDQSERPTVYLHSIPAEYIFEVPPRASDDIRTTNPHSRRRFGLQNPFKSHTVEDSAGKSRKRGEDDSHTLPSLYWLHSPSSPLSPGHMHRGGLSDVPEDGAASSSYSSATQGSRSLRSSNHTSSNSSKYRTWHRRPSTPYTPRDARGEYESVTELARFIRRSGQEKAAGGLVPKDAKGEYGSVEELTRFVQLYAPDQPNEAIPLPLNIDPRFIADLRMERILNGATESTVSTPTAESLLGVDYSGNLISGHEANIDSTASPQWRSTSPVGPNALDGHGSMITQRLPTRSDSHLPLLQTSRHQALEVLQPAIYQPLMRRPRAGQTNLNITLGSDRHVEDHGRPPSIASSIPSVYKGLTSFDRRMMARQDALNALEGGQIPEVKPTNKPLPPKPGSIQSECSSITIGTPSAVSTLRFFDKVLGRRT